MNKRARTRLIGVTAVILIAIAAVVLLTGNKQGAVYSTVPKVTEDASLIGKRVKVGGTVVEGSWDKKSNPMVFVVRDEADKTGSGPTIKVIYTGAAPSTFGDGVVAIVTGVLEDGQTLKATEMITKCPSKYESAQGAIPVADLLLKGEEVYGKPVRATGYVKAGTIADAGGRRPFRGRAERRRHRQDGGGVLLRRAAVRDEGRLTGRHRRRARRGRQVHGHQRGARAEPEVASVTPRV